MRWSDDPWQALGHLAHHWIPQVRIASERRKSDGNVEARFNYIYRSIWAGNGTVVGERPVKGTEDTESCEQQGAPIWAATYITHLFDVARLQKSIKRRHRTRRRTPPSKYHPIDKSLGGTR